VDLQDRLPVEDVVVIAQVTARRPGLAFARTSRCRATL
jgi:hypothetical protein